ncbi:DUF3306 domain-containing protein [Actimicrobium sp. CCI2.3]|uniref:DUF3306 domain-containing protein n=1 Tax=Actimicrobium sp. CCI2.3 TaxID=3048616 RepID=UPI002AB4A649|nr:DUF3306 domain-containing protein [Actimicrobium sp. CCI2.3]MDY7575748.1 DUF3306 domain-containing protein [Actimicrobium sp. CCI2.3]MEB0023787.1 DUF3306 domain-containing protein [Actimicrobium sp. CCI2.3]
MAADDFFSRWSKKSGSVTDEAVQDSPPEETTPRPLPTLEDVAVLNSSSDFSPFFAQGVDDVVKRLALKKLFSDPRFNIMDGLDTYIEDYNSFVPMTADMVSELNHAKLLMNPLAHLEQPFMQMLDAPLPELVKEDDQTIAVIDDVAVVEPEIIHADSVEECEPCTVPVKDVPEIVEVTDCISPLTIVDPSLPAPESPASVS